MHRNQESELSRENVLFRDIDISILEMQPSLSGKEIEELILRFLARFCREHGFTSSGICLVYTGTGFLRLSSGARNQAIDSIPLYPVLAAFAERKPAAFVSWPAGSSPSELEETATGCIAGPIYTESGHLLCVLIVPAANLDERQRIHDSRLPEAMDGLLGQLSIAYRQFERNRFDLLLEQLWEQFLASDLSPGACFNAMAKAVPAFFPAFGPLAVEDESLTTQILMLPKEKDNAHSGHLTIRGTTGTEHPGTRLAIENSISGILIRERDRPYFCEDPRQAAHKAKYRNYFGANQQRARTEMVVRLMNENEPVGVINIESSRENAFSIHHLSAILDRVEIFGNFAAVFERRLLMNTEMQNSVAASTNTYLEALAAIFRHGLRSPRFNQTQNYGILGDLALDLAREVKSLGRISGRTDPQTQKHLDRIESDIGILKEVRARLESVDKGQQQYATDFINDIALYAEEGFAVLREMVDSSIRLAQYSLLDGTKRRSSIRVTADTSSKNTNVFCSTLVKQHLYSVFHNAVDAIEASLNLGGPSGQINVSIAPEAIPAGRERNLNKAWTVRIRDNGRGVNAGQLDSLRRFEPGVKFKENGNGSGLVALHRYIQSINGRIELNSQEGKYFEVVLYFEEYNRSIHGKLNRLRPGRSIDG